MGAGEEVLIAIRQEGLLSLTFGLAMLIAAVALAVVLRNTIKQVVKDATSKTYGPAKQSRALRRLARAGALFGFLMIASVFAAWHLLDAGAWFAVNDPLAWLVSRTGPAMPSAP